ncbi:TRAP transporter small permease [Anaerotruncus rubiinfantis]|uniref:TRAP transporter small permease n=1 Tax=Anaerotruncus rubiinfantis TaxID=1720200 RepID=UPI00189723AD|nr:TRAP transporter small permease [Anaerotruncus rubiinfantis]
MKVWKWLDEHLEETIVAGFLAGVALLMGIQVILRYVFLNGLSWSEVIARYFLVMMGFLSLGYSIRHRSSIRIDMLINILPKPFRRACGVVVWFITFFVLLILFHTAVTTTVFYEAHGRIIAGTNIPVYIIYIIGPVIGLDLGLFRLFQVTVLDFISWRKNRTGEDRPLNIPTNEKEGVLK